MVRGRMVAGCAVGQAGGGGWDPEEAVAAVACGAVVRAEVAAVMTRMRIAAVTSLQVAEGVVGGVASDCARVVVAAAVVVVVVQRVHLVVMQAAVKAFKRVLWSVPVGGVSVRGSRREAMVVALAVGVLGRLKVMRCTAATTATAR
jgi:hypothetical protein